MRLGSLVTFNTPRVRALRERPIPAGLVQMEVSSFATAVKAPPMPRGLTAPKAPPGISSALAMAGQTTKAATNQTRMLRIWSLLMGRGLLGQRTR